VLQTDSGIITDVSYQVGDLLCVNIFSGEEGESLIYNLKGELVFNKLGLRQSKILTVSKDSRFVAMQNGGVSSEDGIILPIEAIVYDLKLKEYVLNFRNESQCLNSGIRRDSDCFIIAFESCMPQNTEELFVCNLSDNRISKLNLEDINYFKMKVCPEFELVAVGKNIRQQVYFDKDFTELDAWPF
jgi:hypothetical protein